MRLSVVSQFPPEMTGVGQYGWMMVRGLARSGQFESIRVLAQQTRRAAPEASKLEWPITTQRFWRPGDWRAVLGLARAVLAQRPDVAWFNFGFTTFGASRLANFLGLAAPMLVRRAGRPTVVTLHDIFEDGWPAALGLAHDRLTACGAQAATRLLLQADAVCVTLQRYAQSLRARHGARNVWHLPQGAAYANPEYLPPPEQPELLYFGSLAPFKGLEVLLQAYAHIRISQPQVGLTIAGSDHPRFPGYSQTLRPAAEALGVRWLADLPEAEVRPAFARASLVVLPYLATTGSSSVLHRAAAFGRPVIASDLPDLRATAEEQDLRLEYTPPGDAQALAAAALSLLAQPRQQAALAEHNLARLRGQTVEHTCARYLEMFSAARARAG